MCQSASSSASTYVAPPGDMFDIVLGATARRDVTEVQLFVHYLNLQTDRQTCRHDRHTDRTEQAGVRGRQTWPRDKQTDGKEERKKERKKERKTKQCSEKSRSARLR